MPPREGTVGSLLPFTLVTAPLPSGASLVRESIGRGHHACLKTTLFACACPFPREVPDDGRQPGPSPRPAGPFRRPGEDLPGAGGSTAGTRVGAVMARGSAGLSGAGLGAGLRPPPAAAPGGLPAPPAAAAGHPRRRCRGGALPSPCASPSPASTPGGRSAGGDRLTRHTRTCGSSSTEKVPRRGRRRPWKTGAGAGCPGRSDGKCRGWEGARDAGASCTKALSSRGSPQPLRWLFLTPTTLVLSRLRITPKAPPSPQRHLFRSRFPVPFSPALCTVPRPLLPEPSPGLPLAPVPSEPPRRSDPRSPLHGCCSAPWAQPARCPSSPAGQPPFPSCE